jgi:hypothetical protein
MFDYKNLTQQDIADILWNRFNDGMGQAVNEDRTSCVYLTSTGNKCAVGVFLPDDHNVQHFGGNIATLIHLFKRRMAGEDWFDFLEKNYSILRSFQMLHDNGRNWDSSGENGVYLSPIGLEKFQDIIEAYGLKHPRNNS